MSNQVEVRNPEGLVNQIIEVENKENEYRELAKIYAEQADKMRAELLLIMNKVGMKTMKHQNGTRVTVTNTQKFKVKDEELLISELKEKKLINFVQRVPAHDAVNTTLLKQYLKTSSWKPEDFKGAEIVNDQHITIVKGQ